MTNAELEHTTLKTTRATLPSDSDMKDVLWVRRRMLSGQLTALATQPGFRHTQALFSSAGVGGKDRKRRLAFAWLRAIADAEAIGAKWTPLMSEANAWPDALARQSAVAALIPPAPEPPAWVKVFLESGNLAEFGRKRLGEWVSHDPEGVDAEAVWARVEKTRAGDPMRYWAWRNLPISSARLAAQVDFLLSAAGKPPDVTDLLSNESLTTSQIDYIANFLESGSTHMAARTTAMARLGSVSDKYSERVADWMLTTAARDESGSRDAANYFIGFVTHRSLDGAQVALMRQALELHPTEIADVVLMHPDTPDDLAIRALKHYRAGVVDRVMVSSRTLRSPAYQRGGAFRDWLYLHPTIDLADALLTDAKTNDEASRSARVIARSSPSEILRMLEEDDPRVTGKIWPDILDTISHNGSAQDRVRVLLLWHKTGEPMPERKSAKSKTPSQSVSKP